MSLMFRFKFSFPSSSIAYHCVFYRTNLVIQLNKETDGSLKIKTNEEIYDLTKRKKRD